MKLTIPIKTLAEHLGIAKGSVSSRTTLPILSHVLIHTHESSVDFTCTDLDLTVRARMDATIRDKGSITVNAKLLHGIIAALPDKDGEGEVTLEVTGKNQLLRITSGEAKYQLGTLSADEFPPLPKLKDAVQFRLPQSVLKQLLASTSAPASAADESRYTLCGTLLACNGSITSVTTDGRRLHKFEAEPEEKLPKAEIIIPRNTVSQLLRLLGDDEDKRVTVTLADNHVRFEFNDVQIISKVIEGNFPNYKQVIPALKDTLEIPIGRADLLECVSRVSILGEAILIEGKSQVLTVSTVSEKSDVPGEAEERLLIPKGRAFGFKVNSRYLTDALKATDDDQVTLHYAGASSPIVVKSPKHAWLAVVMPLRMTEQQDAAEAAKKTAEPPEPPAAPEVEEAE